MLQRLDLKKFIYYLAIFSLFTPFFLGPSFYFPFITLKGTVFRILVEIMLFLWVLYLIKEKKSLSFLKNPIVLSFSLFFVILFLSSIFGLSFHQSFFSSTERLEGLFGILHFYLFFLILFSVFSQREIEDFLKISIFIALIYSFSAILFFYQPTFFGTSLRTDRLMGFSGNPSYFATYLLFHTFFALYFYFKKYLLEKKFFNFYLAIFLFFTLLIVLNATRGVMVGYVIGFLLMSFLLLFRKEKEVFIFKKIAWISIIVLISTISILFLFKNSSFVKDHLFLKRLTTFDLNDPATKSRLLSYKIAFNSFLKRPILGWGGESYVFLYIKNFDPLMPKILPDFMFDRVHNKVLEILIDAGIIGLLSYFLIYYFLFKILKNQSKENFCSALPFFGLFVSYFIQNLFIFDFFESYLPLMLTLAFVSHYGSNLKLFKNQSSVQEKKERKKGNLQDQDFSKDIFKIFLIILAFCLIVFSLTKWIILPSFQYYYIIKTHRDFVLNRHDEGMKDFKRIFYYQTPYQMDVFLGSKRTYEAIKPFLTAEEKKIILSLYDEQGEKILKQRRPIYQFLLNYADLTMDALEFDSSKKEKLKELVSMLEKEGSRIPYTYIALGKYYLVGENNLLKAKENFEKTESMTEFIPDNYYFLALVNANLNNKELSDSYLMKAIEKGFLPRDKKMIYYSANLFVPKKDYLTIVRLYSYGITLYPKEVEFYVKLAAAYGKLKNKEKAIEYAEKAIELMPSLKEEAENFINLIKQEQWDKIPD